VGFFSANHHRRSIAAVGNHANLKHLLAQVRQGLGASGSVRRIQVLRRPGQAADTVQLAMAAVQRAAPFGSVAHLPRPWRYTETFLFDNQRRFKPRTLDL
jgi:hypothetical protein